MRSSVIQQQALPQTLSYPAYAHEPALQQPSYAYQYAFQSAAFVPPPPPPPPPPPQEELRTVQHVSAKELSPDQRYLSAEAGTELRS